MLEAVDEGTCARGSGSSSGRLDVCVLCRSDLMTKSVSCVSGTTALVPNLKQTNRI